MSDPRDRFRTLDRQDAPDLWSEATMRSKAAPIQTSWLPRVAGGLAVAAVVVLAIVIGLQLVGSPTPGGPLPSPSDGAVEPTIYPSGAPSAPWPSVAPEPSTPIGSLSLGGNWFQSARLSHVCRFPVAEAIEQVFGWSVREEEITTPETVTGSVCQLYSVRGGDWLGNLHAYPPVQSDNDLMMAADDLRPVQWYRGTYNGVPYFTQYDYLLIGHDQVTLFVILQAMGPSLDDVHALVGAIVEALDAE